MQHNKETDFLNVSVLKRSFRARDVHVINTSSLVCCVKINKHAFGQRDTGFHAAAVKAAQQL